MGRGHALVNVQVPVELGRLETSHHPISPVLGLSLCVLPGVPIGLGLWLGPTASPGIAVFAFALTTLLLIGLFAESLFVRQQVFEHGLLLSSVVPLTPRYAIPYATIDPESIEARTYHRPKGAADVTDAFARHYRQAPFVDVVTFVGIAPRTAAELARGRIGWRETITTAAEAPRRAWARSPEFERWYASVRNNSEVAVELRRRVASSAQGRST